MQPWDATPVPFEVADGALAQPGSLCQLLLGQCRSQTQTAELDAKSGWLLRHDFPSAKSTHIISTQGSSVCAIA